MAENCKRLRYPPECLPFRPQVRIFEQKIVYSKTHNRPKLTRLDDLFKFSLHHDFFNPEEKLNFDGWGYIPLEDTATPLEFRNVYTFIHQNLMFHQSVPLTHESRLESRSLSFRIVIDCRPDLKAEERYKKFKPSLFFTQISAIYFNIFCTWYSLLIVLWEV